MNVFNPKILDASIRDVSSCLSDNQKADLLLYAMNSLGYEGRSRTVFENAIQSCLQVSTLSAENTAKARILRARARLSTGSIFGAQEDLQAALVAEPDNPEAKALLHQRSVNVEKLLGPSSPPFLYPHHPHRRHPLTRFSDEIWKEIVSFLTRRDLIMLLWVPGPGPGLTSSPLVGVYSGPGGVFTGMNRALSRIAADRLFRRVDLHFGDGCEYYGDEDGSSFIDDDAVLDDNHPYSSGPVPTTSASVNPSSIETALAGNVRCKSESFTAALASSSMTTSSGPLGRTRARISPPTPTSILEHHPSYSYYAPETIRPSQAERTADILTRIITDGAFAGNVRTLRIFFNVNADGGFEMGNSFQMGVLSNAIPKLPNLHQVHISISSSSLYSNHIHTHPQAQCHSQLLLPFLHMVQASHPRLRGLSISINLLCNDNWPEAGIDIDWSTVTFSHLNHFAYEVRSSSRLVSRQHTAGPSASPSLIPIAVPTMTSTSATSLSSFLLQNRSHLQTVALSLPESGSNTDSVSESLSSASSNSHSHSGCLAIRNMTHVAFTLPFATTGPSVPITTSTSMSIPVGIPDILQHGRQLESLKLTLKLSVPANEEEAGLGLSSHFRALSHSIPFLRHFWVHIHTTIGGGLGTGGTANVEDITVDKDLFPSIADFLRDRKELKTLGLTVSLGDSCNHQHSTSVFLASLGFDSSIWGVLPSLTGLKGLSMTYPRDLAPSLGMWLVPRAVVRLEVYGLGEVGGLGMGGKGEKEVCTFLNQLRPGVPPSLLSISLPDFPSYSSSSQISQTVAHIVEHGFPMVRLVRVGRAYWTIVNNVPGYRREPHPPLPSTAPTSISAPVSTSGSPRSRPLSLHLYSSSHTAEYPRIYTDNRQTVPPSLSRSHSHAHLHTTGPYGISGPGVPPRHTPIPIAPATSRPRSTSGAGSMPASIRRDSSHGRDGYASGSSKSLTRPASVSTSASPPASSSLVEKDRGGSSTNAYSNGHLQGSLYVGDSHSFITTASGLELERWPPRRAAFHLRESLESLGCEEGEEPSHQQFVFR
ncbi:hypothetical protein D9758_015468 [Tetrapyrgos nigripes]|uniref:Uncharacterized protein n=1 Tax=Tetrapyrgos nigripes TaxID=182062 RepID=A0A8H5CPP6_9AGAR|nr:hypothetical protein D9758_015468 [Tetrapyrgos nigripes]